MSEFIAVIVTTKDEPQAALIARALVEKKLAACCNILPAIRSIYRWEGVTQDEPEAMMIIKTRQELFPALEAEVKRLHTYLNPEIIALPINAGSQKYLDWLCHSTA